MLGYIRYIISFDKKGRFVQKRSFTLSERLEGASYIKNQQKLGYIVEETSNEKNYNQYGEE